jgi:hypothetical protein
MEPGRSAPPRKLESVSTLFVGTDESRGIVGPDQGLRQGLSAQAVDDPPGYPIRSADNKDVRAGRPRSQGLALEPSVRKLCLQAKGAGRGNAQLEATLRAGSPHRPGALPDPHQRCRERPAVRLPYRQAQSAGPHGLQNNRRLSCGRALALLIARSEHPELQLLTPKPQKIESARGVGAAPASQDPPPAFPGRFRFPQARTRALRLDPDTGKGPAGGIPDRHRETPVRREGQAGELHVLEQGR